MIGNCGIFALTTPTNPAGCLAASSFCFLSASSTSFARAASTYKIQRLGNEAGLPTLADIEAVKQEFAVGA